jgi:hypothetical protein
VYLAANAVNTRIRTLPTGTAYFIGIVFIPRFTGQLVHHQGSLARAALPYGVQLRWGWHRVARAMERGKVSLDARFDRALTWCVECWPIEPVRLGNEQRRGHAIDSSTIARRRASLRCAWLGKGYCHRAQRAVQAHLVAALTPVVWVRGVRGGLVERTRFGTSSAEAVAKLFADVPASRDKPLCRVAAGSATVEQCRAAPEQEALVGRLRRNGAWRRAPRQQRRGQRGRPPRHGPVLHPGAKRPEGHPDEDLLLRVEEREGRVRRWNNLHFARAHQTILDGVRVADPADKRPLLIGPTARELTTAEIRAAYGHRWPGEPNFYVAQGSCALEMPRAGSERAVERRLSLALLAGSLLKAMAAACAPLPLGPWDVKAVSSAGRLANHLGLHAAHFAALALHGLTPRKYRKLSEATETADLQLPLAA